MSRFGATGNQRLGSVAFQGYARAYAEVLEKRLLLTVVTVTNTNDSGDGSLRAAILASNQRPANIINFNIPGDGVHTIAPLSPLPNLNGFAAIDGTTQPGYSGSPLIEISGAGAGASDGLTVVAGTIRIKGLALNGFHQNGIVVRNAAAVTLTGDYIGTDPAGAVAKGNLSNGVLVQGGTATIGSDASGVGDPNVAILARNVISGNGVDGIAVGSGTARIFGNYIGTNAAGTAALGNGNAGIELSGGTGAAIGQAQGIPNGRSLGNVVSGNGASGIEINTGATNPTIVANLIGTDASGTHAVPNGASVIAPYHDGVTVLGASSIRIGNGTTNTLSSPRNIISGNVGAGIAVRITQNNGSSASVSVVGNYIGTDITGNVALGNQGDGIFLGTGALQNQIGGFEASQGNVISGNGHDGVLLQQGSATFFGNIIGLNAAGTAVLGNAVHGIESDGVFQSLYIGDLSSSTGNVISGNGGHGIAIFVPGQSNGTVRIASNKIGTNSAGDGTSGFGNHFDGIYLSGTTARSQIGSGQSGTTALGANTIAFNGRNGVTVTSSSAGNPSDVFPNATINQNSIYSNGALGIDLGNDGVTLNDHLDPDRGPNGLQNFPVVSNATVAAGGAAARYSFDSKPNTPYTLDFYASTEADPSGFGEGKTYLRSVNVTTDATGNASGVVALTNIHEGAFITATATGSQGTSEFSGAVRVARPVITNRRTFYNDSSFDGQSTAINAADVGAIATDKQALLPGGTATFANYTSYDKGLNGIMIDVQGFLGHIISSDFTFKIGNDNHPNEWAFAPTPSQVVLQPFGGNEHGDQDPAVPEIDRIVITWPDGAIKNKWLQVTMKVDNNTALASPDVFYFGNAVGESGDNPANAFVNATDEIGARNDQHNYLNPAPITNVHDYNRDGKVNATDEIIARNNNTDFLTALNLITPTTTTTPGPLATPITAAATLPVSAPARPSRSSAIDDWLDALLK